MNLQVKHQELLEERLQVQNQFTAVQPQTEALESCKLGDKVVAIFARDGKSYPAVIASIHADGGSIKILLDEERYLYLSGTLRQSDERPTRREYDGRRWHPCRIE